MSKLISKHDEEDSNFKTAIKCSRLEPSKNEDGSELFILKSLMSVTINAKGIGKTYEEALASLKENIANLYPHEKKS